MTVTPMTLLARLRIGRAIRNVYDGVMAGESWAIVLAIVMACVVLAAGAYFAFQVFQEANTDSDDLELTAEEKNMMNRF